MDFLHIVGQINYVIDHSAAQWWVIPIVSLFCLIDGFFLFLPSETAIVALASISAKTGYPNIWLLILGASIGAIIGDNIAYFMGRKLGTTRFNWMRRPRGAKAFAWAGKELEKRGAILIFTARYIPVGRIAVNFTAGATWFPWRRFVLLDGIAVVTWAGYSVAVGTFAGRWVHDNPLLGVAIAITFAIVIGFVVDHAMKYLHHFLEKRGKLAPRPEPGLAAAQHADQVQAEAAANAQLVAQTQAQVQARFQAAHPEVPAQLAAESRPAELETGAAPDAPTDSSETYQEPLPQARGTLPQAPGRAAAAVPLLPHLSGNDIPVPATARAPRAGTN
ncbi:DedA family protein [Arthrobacter glacialis]|uniref:DedA family protein n=1 Tax=Arthrobacter glacialis TaxID=1664 RepID=UPI001FAEF1F5|nr:DedA family protein [Arthrobacter glacialis]